jgi:hypothetical protein
MCPARARHLLHGAGGRVRGARALSGKAVKLVGGNFGGPDTVTRLVARTSSASYGARVVVENHPSTGGSTLAAAAVSKAAPDGYTLLFSDARAAHRCDGRVYFVVRRSTPSGSTAFSGKNPNAF